MTDAPAGRATILTGDALTLLRTLPDNYAHCLVTSPPYYAQRKYSAGPGEMGSEASPEAHLDALVAVLRECRRVLRPDGIFFCNYGDKAANAGLGGAGGEVQQHHDGSLSMVGSGQRKSKGYQDGEFYQLPWRLALALRADGWVLHPEIIWQKLAPMPESVSGTRWEKCRVKVGGVSQKSGGQESGMMAFPSMNKIPLIDWADCPGCAKCAPNGGLVLRRGSWRPTRAHEYIFMLTKTDSYFSDMNAVREAAEYGRREWTSVDGNMAFRKEQSGHGTVRGANPASGRNPRSVQTFASSPLTDADYRDGYAPAVTKRHFAAFPISLPTWCIKVSTSEKGCCPACGAQWARVVEKQASSMNIRVRDVKAERIKSDGHVATQSEVESYGKESEGRTTTLGWRATCACPEAPPVPATVLDPFCGSGTSLLAASRLGRNSIGIELSEAYVAFAKKRLHEDAPMLSAEPHGVGAHPWGYTRPDAGGIGAGAVSADTR